MNQFTYEEIQEWVIENLVYWCNNEIAEKALKWPRERIMSYFETHYDEDFEVIGS